jgi:c-di-GMP-binding flagellar brake protein YcgR
MNTENIRRHPRRKTEHAIQVEDTLTQNLLGTISDLSETGMMLVTRSHIDADSLYQCLLHFPPALRLGEPMAVGCQELWSETSELDGLTVVGFRFIDISRDDRQRLKQWVHEPGSRYA